MIDPNLARHLQTSEGMFKIRIRRPSESQNFAV